MSTNTVRLEVESEVDLPPRALLEDMLWLEQACAANGADFADEARKLSLAEWNYDLLRADGIRNRDGLTEAETLRLIARFKRRNEDVWGAFSQAE